MKENYYALLISILTKKPADSALRAMGICPSTEEEDLEKKGE